MKTMNHHFSIILAILIFATVFLQSCTKQNDTVFEDSTGRIEIKITDAPIDNPEVIGAFFTISGVSINGDTNLLPYHATIDLLSYQQGKTKDLVGFELPAGLYDNIQLQLNLQQDAYGNTPGCYIATNDGKKHNLQPSTSLVKDVILPIHNLQINPDETSILIIDFDLRKLIRYNENPNEIPYLLVDDSRIDQAIRAMPKNQTGGIKGLFDRRGHLQSKILVFAYISNTFNQFAEMRVTEYSPRFPSAANSATLDQQGSFYLPFLPRGDYELIFIGIDEEGNSNIIEGQSTSNNLLKQIRVEAGNDVMISGVLEELPPS